MIPGTLLTPIKPYILYIKLGLLVGAVALLTALLWSWKSRGDEVDNLTQWQKTVIAATTAATVAPDSKGIRKPLEAYQVPDAIAGLKRSLDSAGDVMDDLTVATTAAKDRADQADEMLMMHNADFDKKYATAQQKIDQLLARKPAANLDAQCDAASADSRTAWSGWK